MQADQPLQPLISAARSAPRAVSSAHPACHNHSRATCAGWVRGNDRHATCLQLIVAKLASEHAGHDRDVGTEGQVVPRRLLTARRAAYARLHSRETATVPTPQQFGHLKCDHLL